jgi:hypothetical protein
VGYDRLLFEERKLGKAHFCATAVCSTDQSDSKQQQQTVCVIEEVSFKYHEIIAAANCHIMGQRGLD